MKTITFTEPLTAEITIEGYNFDRTIGVYLSTNNVSALGPLSTFDFCSGIASISAKFVPFTGFSLGTSYYNIINTNILTIVVPCVSASCIIRPIVATLVGYSLEEEIEIIIP